MLHNVLWCFTFTKLLKSFACNHDSISRSIPSNEYRTYLVRPSHLKSYADLRKKSVKPSCGVLLQNSAFSSTSTSAEVQTAGLTLPQKKASLILIRRIRKNNFWCRIRERHIRRHYPQKHKYMHILNNYRQEKVSALLNAFGTDNEPDSKIDKWIKDLLEFVD